MEANRELYEKILAAAKIIDHNSIQPRLAHITLSYSYIKDLADKECITFEEMLKKIEDNLNGK